MHNLVIAWYILMCSHKMGRFFVAHVVLIIPFYHFRMQVLWWYIPLMYFLKLSFLNSVKQAHCFLGFSKDVNMPCRLLALHEYQIQTMIFLHWLHIRYCEITDTARPSEHCKCSLWCKEWVQNNFDAGSILMHYEELFHGIILARVFIQCLHL